MECYECGSKRVVGIKPTIKNGYGAMQLGVFLCKDCYIKEYETN